MRRRSQPIRKEHFQTEGTTRWGSLSDTKAGNEKRKVWTTEDWLRDLLTMVNIWFLFRLWWETVCKDGHSYPHIPNTTSLCNVTLKHLPSAGESLFPLLELGLWKSQEQVEEVTPWDTWDSASRAPTAPTLFPRNAALSHQVHQPWLEAMEKRTRSSLSAASTSRQGGHRPVDHPNPGKQRMTAVTRVTPGETTEEPPVSPTQTADP